MEFVELTIIYMCMPGAKCDPPKQRRADMPSHARPRGSLSFSHSLFIGDEVVIAIDQGTRGHRVGHADEAIAVLIHAALVTAGGDEALVSLPVADVHHGELIAVAIRQLDGVGCGHLGHAEEPVGAALVLSL